MSRVGQNKGEQLQLPPQILLPPSPKTQPAASNKPVDYYNLNQSFKATSGMFATTRFFVLTGVLRFGLNLFHIYCSGS